MKKNLIKKSNNKSLPFFKNNANPVYKESEKKKNDKYVVYAGQLPPQDVLDHLDEYNVLFLAGATYLGNSWRRGVIKEFLKDSKIQKCLLIVPEPDDEKIDSWGKFYSITSAGYNQVLWELYWIEKITAITMWLACYFDINRAGEMYKTPGRNHPNSGRTVWIEVGWLTRKLSMGEKFKIFIGAPYDVSGVGSCRTYLEYAGLKDLKWYSTSQYQKKKGISVSPDMIKDLFNTAYSKNKKL